MAEERKPFVDHGALWTHPNGDDFQGNIYKHAVRIARNPRTGGEKLPAWHIIDPQITESRYDQSGNDVTGHIGALWVSYGKRDGTEYLSGKIRIAGTERRVSLWPVDRKSENAPHWRVLPPLDQAPEAKPAPPETPPELDSEVPF